MQRYPSWMKKPFSPDGVAADLRALLSDSRYAERARATARIVSAEDGAGTAAETITGVLARNP